MFKYRVSDDTIKIFSQYSLTPAGKIKTKKKIQLEMDIDYLQD